MLCSKEKCFGCMACYNICPKDAIRVYEDEEGFKRPHIIEEKCIECGLCDKSCPVLQDKEDINLFQKEVYACWSKDSDIRKKSTSGGSATLLSKYIISNNGVVFGAAFDKDLNLKHTCIDNVNDLNKIRGSKYVQSHIGNTYKEVRRYLKSGKKVLFTGTPCQIDGLNRFLFIKYENLYTVDIVCHGVPSPKVFKSYIKYMEGKYKSKVKDISFRYKKPGWYYYSMMILFDNGRTYVKNNRLDIYHRGFLREYFLRPSCHRCDYANTNRVSDVTLADFWGYIPESNEGKNDDKGISLTIVNSLKGKELFNSIRGEMFVSEKCLEEAVNGNKALSKCFPPNDKREEFWKDYNISFDLAVKKYLYPDKIRFREAIIVFTSYDFRERMKKIIRFYKR